MTEKKDILSFYLTELEVEIVKLGESKFRAGQIFRWLHEKKAADFDEMTDISVQLREKLKEYFCVKSLFIKKRLVSNTDDTVKYLYAFSDGEQIETVLMSYRHGNSLCISTQVGCKMNCAFCASGIAGFVRNLEPSEMLSQIYETERNSGKTVDSIVLMGIGEPLDNFDNTVRFLKLISDKKGRNMSLRHVSLSTCGLADKIVELAHYGLGITLSVSLHSADNEIRSKLMPVNKKYDVKALTEACRFYFEKTGRRISLEYALMGNVNDSVNDAYKLSELAKTLNAHVNIININSVKESGLLKSKNSTVFLKTLDEKGVNATVRRTLGADIEAACGQLRRNEVDIL